MKTKGEEFEARAFGTLKFLLEAEDLGLSSRHCEIFMHKGYFSRDRGANIIFDVAVEVTLPRATTYSILWLWECKDYGHPVPVDDVEEFYSKVQQVSGANVKAGIITSAALQKGALAFAYSKGMSVIRLLHESQVYWVSYHRPPSVRESVAYRSREALRRQDYMSNSDGFFILCNGKYLNNAHDFVSCLCGTTNPE